MSKPIVIVLAAGLGTRMKSSRPKVAFPVAGRPLIAWSVEIARAAGAGRVVAVLGHQAELVRGLLDDRYGAGAVDVAIQSKQRGTGDAVMSALPALAGEPDDRIVVITSGDVPLFKPERIADLVAACAAAPSKMAMVATRLPRALPYGRLVRDPAGKLLRIVEHADASPEERAIEEVNAGFYAIALGRLRADVASLTSDNAQGELYLTDLAARAADRGGCAVIEAPFTEVSGINDRVDLAAVEAVARRQIAERWMREGVSMAAPDHTFIDADAGPIGRDCSLGAGVILRGKTRLGERVEVDAGCVLTDCEIGDGAWIGPHSVLAETVVGPRARIGPLARCGPNARIDEEAVIGNFVEVENSHVMAGARANQLVYLGDAAVGARAEIGAGTVTCNNDGFSQYRTTIEAGAFIGSDAQLIAPVTIGREAYVGSGTTITKDVPRGALALSRVKQVNIDGWAERFREASGKRKGRK